MDGSKPPEWSRSSLAVDFACSMRRVRNTHPGVESVNRDGIAAEQIREVDLEAIPGEVVGEKLSDIDIMMLSREMEAGGDRTHEAVLKLGSKDVG